MVNGVHKLFSGLWEHGLFEVLMGIALLALVYWAYR